MEWRGNLEGLFADRIILIEGSHDENFYERIRVILGVPLPEKKFALFIKTAGKKQLRIVRDFYQRMSFDDVSVITDLDYLFCSDGKLLLSHLSLDPELIDTFRSHIKWTEVKDPSLQTVLAGLKDNGEPPALVDTLEELEKKRIFVLRHGAPEYYCKEEQGKKAAWTLISSEADLLESDYLRQLMQKVLS